MKGEVGLSGFFLKEKKESLSFAGKAQTHVVSLLAFCEAATSRLRSESVPNCLCC